MTNSTPAQVATTSMISLDQLLDEKILVEKQRGEFAANVHACEGALLMLDRLIARVQSSASLPSVATPAAKSPGGMSHPNAKVKG